ncbi:MAG: hypothetical protein KDH88_12680, partial [Chromatiales bacterium]|nr:hypothetical protein [Chromatiales bacterium]
MCRRPSESIRWLGLLLALLSSCAIGELRVGDYRLIDMQRVGRFDYRLEYDARLDNTGSESVGGVQASLDTRVSAATVVKGKLHFPPVAAGGSVRSTDRFILRQDRHGRLSIADLSWAIEIPAAFQPNRPPQITSYPPSQLYLGERYRYPVSASDPEGGALSYTLGSGPAGMSIDAAGQITWIADQAGDFPVTVDVRDSGGLGAQQSFVLQVFTQEVPPDPVGIAPPLRLEDSFLDSVRFLFEGATVAQFELQADALEARRVAVVRGSVRERGGPPLAGVRVSVGGGPEFGYALSRDDGSFDLVLNGGGDTVLRYTKNGYLPVQRRLDVPMEDYAVAEEVALTPLDPQVTIAYFGPTVRQIQSVAGSLVDDGDGPRRATLLIPPGTSASYTRSDGSSVTVEQLSLRATEFTVGDDGPMAMPGALPRNSGYTYAVEFSADEVLADGIKVDGKDVHFDRPVAVYVDNFIGFPIGSVVPVGYYNADADRWVAAENGEVIAILDTTGGLAQIDLEGYGQAASDAELLAIGIDEAERIRLAQLYRPGDELWHARIEHLSTWDLNWPMGPPDDAVAPPPMQCGGAGGPSVSGSDLQVAAGTLSESIPLAGTGQALVFDSARVANHFRLDQPLNDGFVHSRLIRTDYRVVVAGQVFAGSVEKPAPNQTIHIAWNGRDGYGREMLGPVVAYSRASNVYKPVRQRPTRQPRVFRSIGNRIADPVSRDRNTVTLRRGDRSGLAIDLSTDSQIRLGVPRKLDGATGVGAGALTVSDVPVIDPQQGVWVGGDGYISNGEPVLQSLVGSARPDGPTIEKAVSLDFESDGELLVASARRIERIVAGTPQLVPGGDRFEDIRRVRHWRVGERLVLGRLRGQPGGARLWSLSAEGEVNLVAGSGQTGCGAPLRRDGEETFGLPFWGTGTVLLANRQELHLTDPSDFVVDPDGEIHLADAGCHVLYWMPPDSDQIFVAAGDGTASISTERGFAGGSRQQPLAAPISLALGEDA